MRNTMIGMALAAVLTAVLAFHARADGADPATGGRAGDGQVTFRMNRIDSVRDFYTRYFGQAPPYRERGDEDLQDSVARCVFAYGEFKARRFDTVILYAGRNPNDPSNLICNVFPINEAAHMRLCAGIGMSFVGADEAKYELTCAEKPDSVGLEN